MTRLNNGTSPIDRIALSLADARLDHGLSQRQLAKLSGVSRGAIAKIERGGRVDPALLVRLGAALVVLDVYRPPYFDADVDVLLHNAVRPAAEWPS